MSEYDILWAFEKSCLKNVVFSNMLFPLIFRVVLTRAGIFFVHIYVILKKIEFSSCSLCEIGKFHVSESEARLTQPCRFYGVVRCAIPTAM